MPDVTDAEMVEIARGIDPVLADVLQRLVDEKDAALRGLRDRLLGVADSWTSVMREPGDGFDRALGFCAQVVRAEVHGSPRPVLRRPETGPLQFLFTLEVRVDADDEADARSRLDARLPLAYAEKGCRLVVPGGWRDEPEPDYRSHDHEVRPGERWELVHVGDLAEGDRIFLMGQRRMVLGKPWHPEEMRPELLRIPMSDQGPGVTKIGPPFEADFLVPRLVEEE
jgi:hypothetical protein